MKTIKKHNPYCKLVEKTIFDNGRYIDLVYGIENDGGNEGLEAYYMKGPREHFYTSRRWDADKIPAKFKGLFEELRSEVSLVPSGSKMIIE